MMPTSQYAKDVAECVTVPGFVPRVSETGRACCTNPKYMCAKCTAHFARARVPRTAKRTADPYAAPDPFRRDIAALRAATSTRLVMHTGTTGEEQYAAPDGYAANLRAYQEANR